METQVKELQAALDTVRGDRATVQVALEHLKGKIIGPLVKTLGVQHKEEILPTVEEIQRCAALADVEWLKLKIMSLEDSAPMLAVLERIGRAL